MWDSVKDIGYGVPVSSSSGVVPTQLVNVKVFEAKSYVLCPASSQLISSYESVFEYL